MEVAMAELEQALVQSQGQPEWRVCLLAHIHQHIGDLIRSGDDSKPLGDGLFEYCLEKACSAPLKQAAAAFIGLGFLLTSPEDLAPGLGMTVSRLALEKGLDSVNKAMRRHEMLQWADAQFPHAIGGVLLALATTATSQSNTTTDQAAGCKFIAAATVPGALQLLRFGTTLPARPTSSAWHIQDCTLLALSHLWLLQTHPGQLAQAEVKLLQSQEYLQAVLQFTAHIQALTEEEHRLLGRSAVPRAQQGVQRNEADVSDERMVTANILCSTQARLLEAVLKIVLRRHQQDICSAVLQATTIVQIYAQAAKFSQHVSTGLYGEYAGILSDGRTLLLAVAPAATSDVKSAAAAAMAAGAAAALQASGVATSVHSEEEILPWQAFYAMAHMAALEAVCGATPAAQLLARNALLPAWRAAASTLQLCSEWLNSEQTRSRLATDTAAHIAVVDNKPTPRFPRNTIFDDVSEAIAKAIQLTWRTVTQLLADDNKSVVGSAVSLILADNVLEDIIVSCVSLPVCGFATPKTRLGRQQDMLLMRGHGQLADMYLCLSRVPALAKVIGRRTSAEAFRMAALSACQFISVKVQTKSVGGSVLVLDSPFVDEEVLKGFTELSAMLHSCGPDWPEVCMDLKVVVALMDALRFAVELALEPEKQAKVCDMVADCCKCLCSALCVIITASYHPCATIESLSEPVHGVSAHDAALHLRHVRVWLFRLGESMPKDLARQLRSSLSKVDQAAESALPLSAMEVASAAGSASRQKPATRGPAGRARSAGQPAAQQERAPSAKPAPPSAEEQQQSAAAAAAATAAADRMAQLLMEEEAAVAAAKGAKQAGKKSRKPKKAAKKAAKTAAPANSTREAQATEQPATPHPAPHGGTLHDLQPSSQPDADAGVQAPPHAGDEAKDSWQLCPLSKARMRDPVIASDGVCYERAALEKWVAERGAVSPMTKETITADVIPNYTLRSLLQALQQPS